MDLTMRQLLPILLILTACEQQHDTPEPQYVARIGDTALAGEEFVSRAESLLKKGYRSIQQIDQQAKMKLLDGVIAQDLLVREGLVQGLDRKPAIAHEIERTAQKSIINKLYEKQALRGDYRSSEKELQIFAKEYGYDTEVLTRQIVCTSEEDALEALQALLDGVSFEDLVPIYSTAAIQRRFGPAGKLGWFKMGQMLPELKEPTAALSPGEYSPRPIKTQMGFHVFKLEARRPLDFAANRSWLEEKARIQKRANDMEQYIHQLRDKYNLQPNREGLLALGALPPETREKIGGKLTLFSWDGGQLTIEDYLTSHRGGHSTHPSKLDSATLHRATENMAGVRIMMEEGRVLGYDRDEEIVRRIEQRRNELIVDWLYRTEGVNKARQQPIEDQHISAYYEANIEQYTRSDGKVAPLNLVHKSIGTLLRTQAENKAMDDFIALLHEKYGVEKYPDALATIDLTLPVRAQTGKDGDKGR